MTENPMGRRPYDGQITTDHDLLVRIDERLTTHLTAFTTFTLESVRDRESIRGRLDRLEDWQKETEGERRANARTIAGIVASSSALTALATWALGHLAK